MCNWTVHTTKIAIIQITASLGAVIGWGQRSRTHCNIQSGASVFLKDGKISFITASCKKISLI